LWTAAFFLVILLVLTVPAGIALVSAYGSAQDAKAALDRVKTDMQKLDIASAKTEMDTAQGDLSDARGSLQSVGFWRDMPGIGVQIRAMEDAAAAGSQTIDAMRDALDVAEVVIDALRGGTELTGAFSTGIAPTRKFEDLSKQEKQDLLAKFNNALPQLRLSRDKIDLALELWNRVPQNQLIAPLKNALQPVADALPKLKQALDEGVPLVEALVPMAGYPAKIRYLVLLQNADELRPGGGFIGTVGTMTLDAGDLSEIVFSDVYNIDNPASYAWKEVPPKPIADRLGIKNWYLRDANWSPDFPTSAAKQLDFFKREVEMGTGKPFPDAPTAVLAIEPGFFKSLLHLTGPIVVDGTTYNENNFFDQIEYQVEQGFLKEGIPLAQRKDIVGKLGAALVDKLKTIPSSRWNEITDLVTTALSRKQIMAYSQDPALLKILDARGWTARAKPTNGDFVWVVDANLAALKTDGVMDKKISYTLDAHDPDNPVATVTLTYKDLATKIDWRYTRYRSYTRLYVPEGATLIKTEGAMKDDRYKTGGVAVNGPVDVTRELGKTVFGAFWSIEPGQTGTLSFTYKLPASVLNTVDETGYHLDWPKQAGADRTALTASLLFDKTIVGASPSEERSNWGDATYEYQTDSLQDQTIHVSFK